MNCKATHENVVVVVAVVVVGTVLQLFVPQYV